ncbi:MAG: mechanosensitive ion channel family protein [Actinobacteria bacterium]|nr:mechanosensitive ion channel family protein [Actinomycetota bacterium]
MEHSYIYELLRKLGLSEFGATTGEFLLVRPLKILVIVVAAILASRIGGRAVRRFVRSVHARAPLLAGSSLRAEQRTTTVGDALAGMLKVMVWAVAALLLLDQLGVNLAPLIAGAGIAGIALGFGAQSLVKDFLSGLFILLEDQYGVGDIVDLGDKAQGVVEDVNLRVSRVRAVDGAVWFVPNGEIRKVGNSSMEWSRALLDVVVPYDSDTTVVTAAIHDVAVTMAQEDAWQAAILEPPELWGVEAMGPEGMTVRLVVKTAPRQQFPVARELRARINARLRDEGVRVPAHAVRVTAGQLDQVAPPGERS